MTGMRSPTDPTSHVDFARGEAGSFSAGSGERSVTQPAIKMGGL